MGRRVSFSILIACAILCLGAGVGIGYAIEASHSRALDSEITEKENQMAVCDEQMVSLSSETVQLQSDLKEKQAECAQIKMDLYAASSELDTLSTNYTILTDMYQDMLHYNEALSAAYESLENACTGNTVDEILDLRSQVSALNGDIAWLNAQIVALENQRAVSPDHALERAEVFGNPKFESTAWKGQDYDLRIALEDIGESYNNAHTYIEGEFDCNDMAVELWNILFSRDIKSVIVIGDRDESGETFEECNHAWLYVFDAEGQVIYMEPTSGQTIYGRLTDGTTNPDAAPYREGFIYERPSDLWKDLCSSNHSW
jgi:predicted  nucleic acid-binding Zn-ribbon protein